MLLAIPTETVIFILILVLIVLGIIAVVFYAAAHKVANSEAEESPRSKKDAEQVAKDEPGS